MRATPPAARIIGAHQSCQHDVDPLLGNSLIVSVAAITTVVLHSNTYII